MFGQVQHPKPCRMGTDCQGSFKGRQERSSFFILYTFGTELVLGLATAKIRGGETCRSEVRDKLFMIYFPTTTSMRSVISSSPQRFPARASVLR